MYKRQLLGYGNDYSILDEDDSLRLLKHCVTDLGLKDKKFPKPRVLNTVISLAANRGVELADTVKDHFAGHEVDIAGILKVAERYAQRKRELNAMDFDDLLVNGLRLLREHTDVAAYYQRCV